MNWQHFATLLFAGIIIDALMDTVEEYFHITEVQLEKLTASFIKRLPKYMQGALEWKESAMSTTSVKVCWIPYGKIKTLRWRS